MRTKFPPTYWIVSAVALCACNFLLGAPASVPAQVPQEEIEVWKQEGKWDESKSIYDPEDAAYAMQLRLDKGLEIFHQVADKQNKTYTPLDDFMIIPIIQNINTSDHDNMKGVARDILTYYENGGIQWNSYALNQSPKEVKSQNISAFLNESLRMPFLNNRAHGQNYDTVFMFQLYYNDLVALTTPDPNQALPSWPVPNLQYVSYLGCVKDIPSNPGGPAPTCSRPEEK